MEPRSEARVFGYYMKRDAWNVIFLGRGKMINVVEEIIECFLNSFLNNFFFTEDYCAELMRNKNLMLSSPFRLVGVAGTAYY